MFRFHVLSLTVKSKNDVAEAIVLYVLVLVERLITLYDLGIRDNKDKVEAEVANLAMVLFSAGYPKVANRKLDKTIARLRSGSYVRNVNRWVLQDLKMKSLCRWDALPDIKWVGCQLLMIRHMNSSLPFAFYKKTKMQVNL